MGAGRFGAVAWLAYKKSLDHGDWNQRRLRGSSTLVAMLRRWMSDLRWNEAAPWKWIHPTLEDSEIRLDEETVADWQSAESAYTDWKGRAMHLLREAWRKQRWHATSNRRETPHLESQEYDSKLLTNARKLYDRVDGNSRRVMFGDTVSAGWFEGTGMGRENVPCFWCGEADPSWLHMAWRCPRPKTRDRPAEPPSFLQRRFGWPTGEDAGYNLRVARHLGNTKDAGWETCRERHGAHL